MHASDTSVPDEIGAIVDQIVPTDAPRDLNPSSSFTDDLGLDSLALVQLALAIEERFGVRVSDADAASLRTVGDAVAYVERHLADA